MVAIITGDVINSEKVDLEKWLSVLKGYFNTFGKSPVDWAIYRGDEFQLRIRNVEEAYITAIQIKAKMKQFKDLDVRLSIGFGDDIIGNRNILESNGTAFIRSGRTFDDLRKNKTSMLVNTGNQEIDQELNLYINLALTGIIDTWTVASAEMVSIVLQNQRTSQDDISKKTGLSQSAISQRLKRANFEVLMDLNRMFVKKIINL